MTFVPIYFNILEKETSLISSELLYQLFSQMNYVASIQLRQNTVSGSFDRFCNHVCSITRDKMDFHIGYKFATIHPNIK